MKLVNMLKKIWLDRPTQDNSVEYILKYLKYNHNKIHILHAYDILRRLNLLKDSIVIELGCSGYESLILFHKMGFKKILAADYNKELLEVIKNNFKDNPLMIYHTDFNNPLPLESGSIDLVNTLEVVEHIVKAEFYLSEIYRVLKKEGYLLISTPNHAFYMSRWRALKGDRLGSEGVHLRFFTKEHFEAILKDSGFYIIKRNSVGHFPLINNEPCRTILKRKRIHHYIPESLESLFAINFVWLCKKQI